MADTILFDTPGAFATAQTITLTNGQLDLTDAATHHDRRHRHEAAVRQWQHREPGVRRHRGSGDVRADDHRGPWNTGLGGGGLANFGTLALTDCSVSGNAGVGGGGLPTLSPFRADQLHHQRQHGHGNNGGGLYIRNGTASLTNCTISGNSAALISGGLFSGGATTTLINCTVSGNSAGNNERRADRYHRQRQSGNTIVAGNTAA